MKSATGFLSETETELVVAKRLKTEFKKKKKNRKERKKEGKKN